MSACQCPKCKEVIGFWSIFKSSWPTRVFCPNCKSKLRFEHGHRVGIIATVIAIVLIYPSVILANIAFTLDFSFLYFIYTLFIWLTLFEIFLLGTTVVIRHNLKILE